MAVGTIVIHDAGPQGPVGNNKADIILYFQYVLENAEVLYEYVPSANQTIMNANSSVSVPSYSLPTANAHSDLDEPSRSSSRLCPMVAVLHFK